MSLRRPGCPARRLQGAGDVEKLLAGRPLQLTPQLERAAQQRHVGRVLVVRQADDARLAVRRAHLMGDPEPLQAQDPAPAARQVVSRCAAHAADPGDDHVIVLHVWILWLSLGCATSSLAYAVELVNLDHVAGCGHSYALRTVILGLRALAMTVHGEDLMACHAERIDRPIPVTARNQRSISCPGETRDRSAPVSPRAFLTDSA